MLYEINIILNAQEQVRVHALMNMKIKNSSEDVLVISFPHEVSYTAVILKDNRNSIRL